MVGSGILWLAVVVSQKFDTGHTSTLGSYLAGIVRQDQRRYHTTRTNSETGNPPARCLFVHLVIPVFLDFGLTDEIDQNIQNIVPRMQAVVIFAFFLTLSLCSAWQFTRKTDRVSLNRHQLVKSISATLVLVSMFSFDGPSFAADKTSGPLIYKSGKNPVPPNPPDSKDGTKKDTNFLRCVSNCKSNCQRPG